MKRPEPAVADDLALSARLELEEPTLPGAAEMAVLLRRYRRDGTALLLALVVHTAVLTLGFRAEQLRKPAPAVSPLSVSLNMAQGPRPPSQRRILLAERGEKQALPPVVPLARPRQQARPQQAPAAGVTVVTPAPPALFDWWQYGSSSQGYFGPQELDVRSEPITREVFLQGLADAAPSIRGQLLVRLYINATGGVDRVEIQEADPAGVFEEITLRHLYQLRFNPAQKDGLFVKSFKDVVLTFDEDERRSSPGAVPPATIPAANGVPSSR